MAKTKDRTGAIVVGAGALFIVAGLSQGKVQIFDGPSIVKWGRDSNRFAILRHDYAKRGSIVSSDGKPLAEDRDAYRLVLNFKKAPHSEGFFMDLSAASGIPVEEFETASWKGGRTWPQEIDGAQAKAINEVRSNWRADGLSLERIERRSYPLGDDSAAVVGQLPQKIILKGKERMSGFGLEWAQNKALAGSDGQTTGLLDRNGSFLPMRIEGDSVPAVDGQTILTTIDSEIQQTAAQVVKDTVIASQATQGIAIVMDPKTGDVLAMASYPTARPTAKPNQASPDQIVSDLNSCTQTRFEPGSMFKILTLAKAYDLGVVNERTTIDCEGTMKVGKNKPFHCDKNESHHLVTPELAIAESCNIAAAHYAQRIQYGRMTDYIKKLGLLRPVLDGQLLGEAKGQFRESEPAKDLQLAHVGFGQSITATPIGLISAFSMVANDGVRMDPRLVQSIGDKARPSKSTGRVVDVRSAEFVKKCMVAVFENKKGTAYGLRIPGYKLAGKTGTAQKIGPIKGHISNFVGFVPAENPRAVALVMIDDPKKGSYYGAQLAGPAFREIAKGIIRRYNLQPTEPIAASKEPAPAARDAGKRKAPIADKSAKAKVSKA